MVNVGSLQVVLGPMFSGKTTEMMRRVKRFEIARQRCVVMKYKDDQRYSHEHVVCTHAGDSMPAVPASQLLPLFDWLMSEAYTVVGIDEGQFFEDVVPFCIKAVDAGLTVVVAALDGTFRRAPFGKVLHLIPYAERVDKLVAVCAHCHERDAPFSHRFVTCSSSADVHIGGAESYAPLCRGCFEAAEQKARTLMACMSPVLNTSSCSCDDEDDSALVPSDESDQTAPDTAPMVPEQCLTERLVNKV